MAERRIKLTADDILSPVAPEDSKELGAGVPLDTAPRRGLLTADDILTRPAPERTVKEGRPERDLSTGELLAGGAKRGALRLWRGLQQKGADWLGVPLDRPALQKEIDDSRISDAPYLRTVPGALGFSAPGMAAGLALPGGTLARAVGSSAFLSGLEDVASDETLLGNAAWGAAGGAAGYGAGKAVGKGLGFATNTWRNSGAQALFERAQQRGVPLSLGDVTRNPVTMRLEDLLEQIPGSGRGKFLERQVTASQDMLDRELQGYLAKAGAQTAEEAPYKIMRDLIDQYNGVVKTNGRLYDRVELLAADPNVSPVFARQLKGSLRTLLDEYPGIFQQFGNSRFLSRLEGLASDLGENQRTRGVNAMTFGEARELEKKLGSLVGQADKLKFRGNIDDDAYRAINAAYASLQRDMDDWARTVGSNNRDVKRAYDLAKKDFRENVLPYRKHPVAGPAVMQSEVDPATGEIVKFGFDPDQLVAALFKPGRGHLSDQSARLLGPDGLSAAQLALANREIEAALSTTNRAGLAPGKFLAEQQRLAAPRRAVMDPVQEASLSQVESILSAARRAPDFLANPLTGVRAIPFIQGAAVAGSGSPLTAAALGIGTGKVGNLLTTNPLAIRALQSDDLMPTAGRRGFAAMGRTAADLWNERLNNPELYAEEEPAQ